MNKISEALSEPQARHRGMVVETDGYRGIGLPIKLTETPGQVRFGPRSRGEDNEEILGLFGFSEEEMASFEEDGVISSHSPAEPPWPASAS